MKPPAPTCAEQRQPSSKHAEQSTIALVPAGERHQTSADAKSVSLLADMLTLSTFWLLTYSVVEDAIDTARRTGESGTRRNGGAEGGDITGGEDGGVGGEGERAGSEMWIMRAVCPAATKK